MIFFIGPRHCFDLLLSVLNMLSYYLVPLSDPALESIAVDIWGQKNRCGKPVQLTVSNALVSIYARYEFGLECFFVCALHFYVFICILAKASQC